MAERSPNLTSPPASTWWITVAFCVVVTLVGVRVHFLALPLERDEGEYAYAGQLLLQGMAPYSAIYSMKWPGTYAAYAVTMAIFGQTTVGIHAGLLLVNLATAVIVFVMAERICGRGPAVAAAGTCAVLSAIPTIYGFAGHATHFVALFAAAGVLLLQDLDERTAYKRIFVAGLLLGTCMLMKQAGAAFAGFAAVWVLRCEAAAPDRSWRRTAFRVGVLSLGCSLPILAVAAALYALGAFDRFWLWTFRYAREYTSIVSFRDGIESLGVHARLLFKSAPELWLLAAAGIVPLCIDPALRRWRFFILVFAIVSFLAVCPGGYFRGHYFLLLLPAIGLLAGITAYAASQWMLRAWPLCSPDALPALAFLPVFFWTLLESRTFLFALTPDQASRAVYGGDPFPESVEISRYLAAHCPPEGRVAVIGSEPQIYFYARRRAATGYVYMFPLMEPQPFALDMQRDMIHEIEQADPEYAIFVNIQTSWQTQPTSSAAVFRWFRDYQENRLELVAVVRILSPDHTEYDWGDGGAPSLPASGAWIGVFRRRQPAPRGLAPARASTP